MGAEDDTRAALARSISARVHALADAGDELRVIDGFLLRLELGRDRHGVLDLRRDRRDWAHEGDEEVADWAVYRALDRTSKRLTQIDAIEQGLDELREAEPDECPGCAAGDIVWSMLEDTAICPRCKRIVEVVGAASR